MALRIRNKNRCGDFCGVKLEHGLGRKVEGGEPEMGLTLNEELAWHPLVSCTVKLYDPGSRPS